MCPPGGRETLDVGRSVSTLKEFEVLEEAKALLETRGCVGPDKGRVDAVGCSAVFSTLGEALFVFPESSFSFSSSEVVFSLIALFFSFSVFAVAAFLFLLSRFLRIRSNSSSVYPPIEI